MAYYRNIGFGIALALLAPRFAAAFDGGSDCTQTVGESASVAQPIALVNVAGLNFGRIISGAAQGTITVSAAGQVTSNGVANGPAVYTGSAYRVDPSAATFYVTGEPGYSYTIITPATSTVSDGAGHTMTVTLSAPSAQSVSGYAPSGYLNANGTSSTIASNGFDAWAIGATITVSPNQASGTYSGTFAEEVQYQ